MVWPTASILILLLHLYVKAGVEQGFDHFAGFEFPFDGEGRVLVLDIGTGYAADGGNGLLDGAGALAAAVVNTGDFDLFSGGVVSGDGLVLDLVIVELAIKTCVSERVDGLLGGGITIGGDLNRLRALVRLELHAGHILQRGIDGLNASAAAEVSAGNRDFRFSAGGANEQQHGVEADEREQAGHERTPTMIKEAGLPTILSRRAANYNYPPQRFTDNLYGEPA